MLDDVDASSLELTKCAEKFFADVADHLYENGKTDMIDTIMDGEALLTVTVWSKPLRLDCWYIPVDKKQRRPELIYTKGMVNIS